MNELKEREEKRKKRQKAKKKSSVGKKFLMVIAVLIVAFAAFIITMKICDPDFEIASVLPIKQIEQAVDFVKEDVFSQTTTTEPKSTTTTTRPTTTVKADNYDYVEFSDFDFDTSLQGNQLGNLLNKTQGAVTYSSSYIYYSISNKGVYRFEPNEETNSKVNVDKYNFKYLNVLGDYIYFVDTESNKLKKSQVSGGDMVNVADDISFAYLYNDKIYYIGTDNSVGYITTDDMSKITLYTAPSDKEVQFVGISLSRIFFTQYDEVADYYEYITVAIDDKSDKQYFMDDSTGDSMTYLQLECGYFYYYQKQSDDTFDLCRQKFGSEKTVTLIEDCSVLDYPIIYSNRLYYATLSDGKYKARELNMNSMDKKTMVTLSDVDSSGNVGIGYGYQYVFLFGSKTADSDPVYVGSCIYTSSSGDNKITFKKGKWTY
ncbi:MAG: DUF5050 domain-containing protein [Clostridiales bacterium]|nr:DUF5050 domain-containing protein [Clostridiales bacterium]